MSLGELDEDEFWEEIWIQAEKSAVRHSEKKRKAFQEGNQEEVMRCEEEIRSARQTMEKAERKLREISTKHPIVQNTGVMG